MLQEDVQVISVDDHVIEHERVWLDRLPAKYLEVGPAHRRDGRWHTGLEVRGPDHPHYRAQCRGGEGAQGFRRRPRQLRRDAPGLLRRHRPTGRHGPRRRPRADVLPVLSGVRRRNTLFAAEDKDSATACVVAWNDFILDEWCAAAPDRFIPMVMVPFWDVAASVAEVERTAAKGAKAITFTEAPHRLGLPSFHSDHWDPFLAAAQAADMPLCLHFGTGGAPAAAPDANFAVAIALFGMNSQSTTVDLLLSPVLQVPASPRGALRGGHRWIPYVLERVDYTWERHRWYTGVNPEWTPTSSATTSSAASSPTRPESRSGTIGVDNIMFEGDYPHSDTIPGVPQEAGRVLSRFPTTKPAGWPKTMPIMCFNFSRR